MGKAFGRLGASAVYGKKSLQERTWKVLDSYKAAVPFCVHHRFAADIAGKASENLSRHYRFLSNEILIQGSKPR